MLFLAVKSNPLLEAAGAHRASLTHSLWNESLLSKYFCTLITDVQLRSRQHHHFLRFPAEEKLSVSCARGGRVYLQLQTNRRPGWLFSCFIGCNLNAFRTTVAGTFSAELFSQHVFVAYKICFALRTIAAAAAE